jgi:hypothetical protein
MRFRSHQSWFPRDAEKPLEYEDASAHSEKLGRAVIADGVSSAIFSRTWARLLTRTAVVEPPALTADEEIAAWLQPLKQAWQQEIRRAKISVPMWAVMPKINSIGGQATLLIVEIEPIVSEDGAAGDRYRLRARGIGDSILYVIRGGEKVLSFPITDSAEFDQPPWVLSSITKDAAYADKVHHLDTECRVGDLLVLCTDAIGKWSMREYEAGRSVDWMRYWGDDQALHADVVRLRDKATDDQGTRLVVDDCTLLLLEVVPESAVDAEPETQPDRSDEPFVLLTTAGPAGDGAVSQPTSDAPGSKPPPADDASTTQSPSVIPSDSCGQSADEQPASSPDAAAVLPADPAPAIVASPTPVGDAAGAAAVEAPVIIDQPMEPAPLVKPESADHAGQEADVNAHPRRRTFIESLAEFFGGTRNDGVDGAPPSAVGEPGERK